MRLSTNIGLFDPNPANDRGFRFCYFNGKAPWSTTAGIDFSDQRVLEFARLARDGGRAFHSRAPMPAAKLCVLDVEHPDLNTIEPAAMADKLSQFKATAPDVMVGVYGFAYNPTGFDCANHDTALKPANRQAMLDVLAAQKPAIDQADYLNGDVYLLGPATLSRDLDWIELMSELYAEIYPGKPWIPWIWGAWHRALEANRGLSILSTAICRRYINVLRKCVDGVILFYDSESDNANLVPLLQRRANTLTKRPLNWAQEIWNAGRKSIETANSSLCQLQLRM